MILKFRDNFNNWYLVEGEEVVFQKIKEDKSLIISDYRKALGEQVFRETNINDASFVGDVDNAEYVYAVAIGHRAFILANPADILNDNGKTITTIF